MRVVTPCEQPLSRLTAGTIFDTVGFSKLLCTLLRCTLMKRHRAFRTPTQTRGTLTLCTAMNGFLTDDHTTSRRTMGIATNVGTVLLASGGMLVMVCRTHFPSPQELDWYGVGKSRRPAILSHNMCWTTPRTASRFSWPSSAEPVTWTDVLLRQHPLPHFRHRGTLRRIIGRGIMSSAFRSGADSVVGHPRR